MPTLRKVLEPVFPEESFLDGLRLHKHGRRFSIKKSRSEQAVGIDLDKCGQWLSGKKKGDGLFVCLPPDSKSFLVVIVELKGGHLERAIDQLSDTTDVLCSGPDKPLPTHSESVGNNLGESYKQGHTGRVLGVVVGRGGLPAEQFKKKMTRKRTGLKIAVRSARRVEVTFEDLARWFRSAS